ncbi:MAG: hypothetical protein IPM82_27830 [Saprospiraceae bacterium]|nr:hypothetical protein [Saprospiraceae bacterium]
MSYDIHLYRKLRELIKISQKYPDSKDDYFSELSENLVPFSPGNKKIEMDGSRIFIQIE